MCLLITTQMHGVSYQLIRYTESLSLMEEEKIEFLDLPLPVTLTVIRKDQGLIDLKMISSESSMLEIMLDEESNLSGTELKIRVQEDSQVLVY